MLVVVDRLYVCYAVIRGIISMAHNEKAFVSGGHKCNFKLTASCPPACTNAVLAAVKIWNKKKDMSQS